MLFEFGRKPEVVLIAESKPSPLRLRCAQVPGCTGAGILSMNQLDSISELLDNGRGVIGGAIVDDEYLEWGGGLSQNCL